MKLEDQLRSAIRFKHFSLRTEERRKGSHEGHVLQAEKPKPSQRASNGGAGAAKSNPHEVSPGALHRESFNNRYHCGFAQ
jgi:hypothetical protein